MIPMGDLDEAPTFATMLMKLQIEWDTLAKELGLKTSAPITIVYEVLLYGCTENQLLLYFRTFLDVLKHHRASLKLKR